MTAAARVRNAIVSGQPTRRSMRVALGEAMLSIGAARTAQAEFEALADYPRLLKSLRFVLPKIILKSVLSQVSSDLKIESPVM